jgi:3-hydroxybutyryl-CoA dehydratase
MSGPEPVTHAIGRAEIDRYAELSGDNNPLHMDPEYAATTPFKTVIAHGPVAMQTVFEALAQWLGGDRVPPGIRVDVSYRGPVHIDDRVSCRCEDVADHAGDLALTLRATNQHGGEVLQALAIVPRHLAPRER